MSTTVIRGKGQLTIPADIRQAARLEEGDPIEVDRRHTGVVLDALVAGRRGGGRGGHPAARFFADFEKLSTAKEAFRDALSKFVADLKAGHGFRNGLRVKGVKGAGGVYELTWADDGRATFGYGETQVGSEPHVIWRRVGTHAIFGQP